MLNGCKIVRTGQEQGKSATKAKEEDWALRVKQGPECCNANVFELLFLSQVWLGTQGAPTCNLPFCLLGYGRGFG